MAAPDVVEAALLHAEVLMTSTHGSSDSHLPRETKTLPLWLRTKQRLDRMETWSARHRITSDGFNERIQLQDERLKLASRHLVLLIKEWEERQNEKLTF